MPWSSTTMGFQLEFTHRSAGVVITSIAKGGPADVAGLRVGDRIDFRDIPFKERWRLRDVFKGWGGPAGERLRYVVHRGPRTVVAIVSPQRVAPSWPNWTGWISIAGAFWILLFATVLASRRPDLVEARLLSLMLLFVSPVNSLTGLGAPWPPLEFVAHTFGGALFIAVPTVCLALLAARSRRPLSITRRLLTFATFAGAVAFAVNGLVWFVFGFLFALPVYWAYKEPYSSCVALLGSLACLIAAAMAARGAERTRLFWIAASVLPVWLYYVIADSASLFFPWAHYQGVYRTFNAIAFALLPIGLTYAVLSRRIVDLDYVVNRATVFSVISLFVVGVFVIVEWAFSTWASSASHTTSLAVNVAVALALGLSIRFIHARVEYGVDRIFFRKRHEDEVALRRFAREAAYITEPDALLDRTVKVVEQHTEARRVELLILDGAREYVPVRGDGAAKSVDENDPAVLAMRTWHDPVDLHRYETALKGESAFPMSARGRLLGILVCGAKRGGEAYAPDESEALTAVAQGVGSALGVLKSDRADMQSQMLDAQAQLLDVQIKILDALHSISDRLPEKPNHAK